MWLRSPDHVTASELYLLRDLCESRRSDWLQLKWTSIHHKPGIWLAGQWEGGASCSGRAWRGFMNNRPTDRSCFRCCCCCCWWLHGGASSGKLSAIGGPALSPILFWPAPAYLAVWRSLPTTANCSSSLDDHSGANISRISLTDCVDVWVSVYVGI